MENLYAFVLLKVFLGPVLFYFIFGLFFISSQFRRASRVSLSLFKLTFFLLCACVQIQFPRLLRSLYDFVEWLCCSIFFLLLLTRRSNENNEKLTEDYRKSLSIAVIHFFVFQFFFFGTYLK